MRFQGAGLVLVLGVLVSAAGCSSSPAKTATAATSSPTSPAAGTTTKAAATSDKAAAGSSAAQLTKKIRAWEPSEAINTSSWYPAVVSFEPVAGGSGLFIHTKLGPQETSTGQRICGAYSLYTQEDRTLTTIFVRAADGQRLATCGPGA